MKVFIKMKKESLGFYKQIDVISMSVQTYITDSKLKHKNMDTNKNELLYILSVSRWRSSVSHTHYHTACCMCVCGRVCARCGPAGTKEVAGCLTHTAKQHVTLEPELF